MKSEKNKKIEELQMLENHLHYILAQKQTVQSELNEINNAVGELSESDEEVYKIVSGIMIKSTKEKLGADLKEKKKMLDSKLEAIEKQEKLLEKRASELKDEVINKN